MQKNPYRGPRFNGSALYAELEKQRNGKPLREFCSDVGNVTPATLARMGQGGNPSADALVQFLLYLGTTDIAPFIDHGDTDG
jgi:hypothetical protein